MGAVICEVHGKQGGPLCCQHVLAGSYGRLSTSPPADPSGLAFVRIDLLDDGSEMLGVFMCQECAAQFGRISGEVLAASISR